MIYWGAICNLDVVDPALHWTITPETNKSAIYDHWLLRKVFLLSLDGIQIK